MSAHTPTPWHAPKPPRDERFDPGVYAVADKRKDGRIASCYGPRESAADNAAHIVRCVNAHDELVEVAAMVAKWPDSIIARKARAALAKVSA